MEWLDIINNRHTTFAWEEDKIPTEEELVDVLQEVFAHIPSKNLQFPYQVRLLRNNDPAISKEIMTICKRNDHKTDEEDPGNPQVLAPWLIGFCSRYVADLESRYETESTRGLDTFELPEVGTRERKAKIQDRAGSERGQVQTENIEIGIMSTYIMLAMANRGIQTGMCQNIQRDYTRAEEIFDIDSDVKNLDFRFIMGVGYGKDASVKHEYFDPRIDKTKLIPFKPVNVEKVYPRPAFDDVIKVIK